MNKVEIEKKFNELLEDFEFSEGLVIHDRGCYEEHQLLEKKVDDYKQRFKKFLDFE